MLKFHKARKDHKCNLCGKKIPKGDNYWREYEDEDGAIVNRKEHTNCEEYNEEVENE